LIRGDSYTQYASAIVAARDQVLNQYNIFELMSNACTASAKKYVKCKLNPAAYYRGSWSRQLARSVVHRLQVLKHGLEKKGDL